MALRAPKLQSSNVRNVNELYAVVALFFTNRFLMQRIANIVEIYYGMLRKGLKCQINHQRLLVGHVAYTHLITMPHRARRGQNFERHIICSEIESSCRALLKSGIKTYFDGPTIF